MNFVLGAPDPSNSTKLVNHKPFCLSDDQQGIVVKLSDIALGKQEIPSIVERDTNYLNKNTAIESGAGESNSRSDVASSKLTQSRPIAQLTEQDINRKLKIKQCLSMFFHMPVDSEKWRPWTMMHGLLPYGQQSRIQNKNMLFNAVDYICYNAIGNDTHMMYVDNNELALKVGPGVQGHEGQFLAMLAQADVPSEQEIHVQGQKFTVADLIEYEKQSCRAGTELTFKLIGLSHYLDSEVVWRNSEGQAWNVERLIFEELKQPINGAACGGTHRLMGLSFAVAKRAERQEQVNGQWGRAQHFISQYQDYAMKYQNHDGSFSTNWFVTQESDIDIKKRLYTTGHIVEWLSFSLPQERLNDPRLQRGVDYLLKLMLTAPALDLEIGPKGHALHALRIFERRVYGYNSNVEEITPQDLATVKKALRMQENMTPSFDSQFGSFPAQNVSFPSGSFPSGSFPSGSFPSGSFSGNSMRQGGSQGFGGGRRGFRRRK